MRNSGETMCPASPRKEPWPPIIPVRVKRILMRILIAEDDGPLAGFLRKGLEAEHYAVDVAPDGITASELAIAYDYDLVVLDLNLPKRDGVAVLREVRSTKEGVPILVLT